jgi:hypothetical protein
VDVHTENLWPVAVLLAEVELRAFEIC